MPIYSLGALPLWVIEHYDEPFDLWVPTNYCSRDKAAAQFMLESIIKRIPDDEIAKYHIQYRICQYRSYEA